LFYESVIEAELQVSGRERVGAFHCSSNLYFFHVLIGDHDHSMREKSPYLMVEKLQLVVHQSYQRKMAVAVQLSAQRNIK
jgi:hypothetical protein